MVITSNEYKAYKKQKLASALNVLIMHCMCTPLIPLTLYTLKWGGGPEIEIFQRLTAGAEIAPSVGSLLLADCSITAFNSHSLHSNPHSSRCVNASETQATQANASETFGRIGVTGGDLQYKHIYVVVST